MNSYNWIDTPGILVGIVTFFFAFFYGYVLIKKHNINYRSIFQLLILSTIGHFIGAYALYIFVITQGGDSIFYWEHATTNYQGLGYYIAFLVLGYAREYLLGNSFLGAFLISGALGLVASINYLLVYKVLLDKISRNVGYYKIDARQLFFPAFLLLCWPSYFFWSAAIIKDNFAFLSISMIMLVAANSRINFQSVIMLIIAGCLGFSVRPYLFVIFAFSFTSYLFMKSKWNFIIKIIFLILLFMLSLCVLPLLEGYALAVHFSGSNFTDVGKYAVQQQKYMSIGTSIPVPTHNPYLTFFMLPYLFLGNLLLPLGICANNFIGLVSSVENAYFLWWLVFFLKNKKIWNEIIEIVPNLSFLFIYFLFGMSCLSLMCTNLGLAMREKMMYVPPFLVCIFLTFAYRRILYIKSITLNQNPGEAGPLINPPQI